jgi:hypothetical protein
VAETPDFLPWYRSAVVRRLALSIAAQLIALTHTSHYLVGVDLSALVDDLLEAGGIAYAAWAAHARITKPMPTLTGSQNSADVLNTLSPPKESK